MNIAATQGIWTLLSCTLIVYILKKQEARDIIQGKREKKYQEIIENLTEKLNILNSLDVSIQDIKEILNKN